MSALAVLREDLRDFAGYRSARSEPVAGATWLNANESPCANLADETGDARRYPEPQPSMLVRALARAFGCDAERVLVGRGSDEMIDLLVRASCVAGRDAVLVAPPVFGMYAVCARLQGARLLEVPLRDDGEDFHVDLEAVARAATDGDARIVFLCSPGNPAGGVLEPASVLALAEALRGRALLVVDEAYAEYAGTPSLATQASWPANLVLLRTLSKAHALAGARVGCLLAAPELVAALRRLQAPYPVPAPCADLALRALAPAALERTGAAVAEVLREREHLRATLRTLACVRRVYPSQANFLLARFADADAARAALLQAGIVVRDMRPMPQLHDALRITIGTPAENDAVVAVLSALPGDAP